MFISCSCPPDTIYKMSAASVEIKRELELWDESNTKEPYFAPAALKMSTHWSGLKNSALKCGAKSA